MINYDSFYLEFANQTIDWLPMDTEELYQENLKKNYDQLEKLGWIDKKITYQFNEHGFRCPSFTNDPSIMFLGCSFTQGIGLDLESTWTYQVAKSLNLRYINLGQGGGSNDTCFRMAHRWIPELKPKIVVFMPTLDFRLEIVTEEHGVTLFNVGRKSKYPNKQWIHFYRDWTSNDTNTTLNSIKNRLAINALCNQHNIKFYFADYLDLNSRVDVARDLAHPGVQCNRNFANIVLNHIGTPDRI